MVGELIMLPLRVGVRVTRLWLRVTEETVAIAAGATTRVIGGVTSRGVDGSAAAGRDASPTAGRDASPTAGRDASPAATRTEAPTRPPARPSSHPQPPPPRPETAPPARPPEPREPSEVARPPERPEPREAARPADPREAEPEHVSEEPTVVEEFAEPGAEEGAGAEIHIEPPWEGYEELSAKQVISRFASASSAELAAVQLYEGSTRRRQTILNAVQRELRARNGSGSPSQ